MGIMEWMIGACIILLWSVMVLLKECLGELKKISANQEQQQSEQIDRHHYLSGSLSDLGGYIGEIRHVANEYYMEFIRPLRE